MADDADTPEPLDDGWEPIPGVGEPEPLALLHDVDLYPELTHPVRGTILRRLRRPRTVAELAEALDVPITRLYHHVNRLDDLGMIRVVATRRVGAVTERRYQAAALAWRLARDAFETLEPRELSLAFGSLFDAAKIGLQREIEAGVVTTDAPDEERFAIVLTEVRLRPERHADLVRRLRALATEFAGDDDEDDPEAHASTLFIAAYPES